MWPWGIAMHMSDGLVSAPVAGACWAAAAALVAISARRVRSTSDDVPPRMGILGAFVFAAQMINVSIPMTGSSGHLGGGLLLAALLGPHAALLTITAVLAVQALLFADGGLLALGCNILNMGFLPAFVAYPWVYRPLARGVTGTRRAALAAVAASVVALLLGAFGVVLQTTASGVTALPFSTFVSLMLPIHAAIGLFEGVVTAAVLAFVARVRPELGYALSSPGVPAWRQPAMVGLLVASALFGSVLSWFASPYPDGLEWSVERTAAAGDAAVGSAWHGRAEGLQARTALLPDYALPQAEPAAGAGDAAAWPAVDAGTSFAGLAGGLATLLAAALVARIARAGAAKPRLEPS